MQFLDPTNDYAFKRVFGDERRKTVLISFLNSILGRQGSATITNVTLLNPYQAPHIKGTKETLLDVRCHDQQGAEYIVEMQVIQQEHFDKRVQYYVSKAYSRQLNRSDNYGLLNPVIFLGVLSFSFTQNPYHISTHRVQDVETRECVLRDFEFTLIELPKFAKSESELQCIADKWVYFLKCAHHLHAVPSAIKETALLEAFETLNQINWTQEEMDYYENSLKTERDLSAKLEFGFNQGHRQGLVEGHQKGLEEGVEQGRIEERRRLARELLAARIDALIIRNTTGLSIEEIDRLR